MGGKSSQSTNQVTIPPDVLARYNAVNATAHQAAQTPFHEYGGQFVAPVNAQQQAGMSGVDAAANQAQPYFQQAGGTLQGAQAQGQDYLGAATQAQQGAYQGAQGYNQAATGLAAAGAGQVNAQQIGGNEINQFMSPYLSSVVGAQAALLNQNNQQAMSGQLGSAISSGAFGGDRGGVAAANLSQQQNLANANIYSNLLNQGYGQALGAAQQQQGVNLGAGQANRAALQNASNQIAGIGQQGYAQGAGTSAALSNLGQTAYGQGAATSAAQAALGQGAQSAALQGAQAQIGAGTVAQQTQQAEDSAKYNQFQQEQSYPFQTAQFEAGIAEGTGSLSGSTTTSTTPGSLLARGGTADRLARYAGGLVPSSEGGAVHPGYAGEGYASGGSPMLPGLSVADYAALMQGENLGPYSGAGLYGGKRGSGPYGGSGYVPAGLVPVSHLTEAEGGFPTFAARKAAYEDQLSKLEATHAATGGAIGGNHFADGGSPAFDMASILAAQNAGYSGLNGAGPSGVGGQGRVPVPYSTPAHTLAVAAGMPKPATAGEGAAESAKAVGDIAKGVGDVQKAYYGLNPAAEAAHNAKVAEAAKAATDKAASATAAPSQAGPNTLNGEPIKLSSDQPGGQDPLPLDDAIDPEGLASGGVASGRATFAMGGLPYSEGQPGGLTIPDTAPAPGALKAPGATDTSSSLDKTAKDAGDIGKIASSAAAVASLFGMATGGAANGSRPGRSSGGLAGRNGYDDGGSIGGYIAELAHAMGIGPDPDAPPTPPVAARPAPVYPDQTLADRQNYSALADRQNHSALADRQNGVPGAEAPTTAPGVAPARAKTPNVADRAAYMPPAPGSKLDTFALDDALRSEGIAAATPQNTASDVPGPRLPLPAPAGLAPQTAPSATGLDDYLSAIQPGDPVTGGAMPGAKTGLGAGIKGFAGEVGGDLKQVGHGALDYLGKAAHGDPKYLVPLLTGIAAATGAPTRNPFTAVTQGLGAGAKSYMDTQQQQAATQERVANVGKTQADTQEAILKNAAAKLGLAQQGMSLVLDDVKGDISIGDGHKYRAVSTTKALSRAFHPETPATPKATEGTTPEAGGTPPGAQAHTPFGLGDEGLRVGQDAFVKYKQAQSNASGMVAESNASRDAVNSDFYAASAARPDINTGAMALSSNQGSPLKPGAFTPIAQKIIIKYNDAMDKLGFGNLKFDPSEASNNQILTKLNTNMSLAKARGANQAAFGAVEAAMAASPNPALDFKTNASLIADNYIKNQRADDLHNYISEYDNVQGGPTGQFLYQDPIAAFATDHNTAQYANDKAGIIKMLSYQVPSAKGSKKPAPGFPVLYQALNSGDPERAARAAKIIDEKSGVPGLSRYFVGRQ